MVLETDQKIYRIQRRVLCQKWLISNSGVLTKSINTKIGLGKGTEAIYIDAAWKGNSRNANTLSPGKVERVVQPDYIVVEVKQQTAAIKVAIKPTAVHSKDKKGIKKGCLQHECESAGAVTHHKMQEKMLKSAISSLNATMNVSKKIHPKSFPSIHVGCSRVYDLDIQE